MPTSYVSLCRTRADERTDQAMCYGGANSIFYVCKPTTNPEEDKTCNCSANWANPQTAVLAGDNEQQQRLEQALMTPDTDEYYNAAAL